MNVFQGWRNELVSAVQNWLQKSASNKSYRINIFLLILVTWTINLAYHHYRTLDHITSQMYYPVEYLPIFDTLPILEVSHKKAQCAEKAYFRHVMQIVMIFITF